MKNIILIVIAFLSTKISFGQTSFAECYDTLHWRLTHDTTFSEDNIISWQNCIKGKSMPLLSFKSITGENIQTKKFLGKVLVINLWFTSCHPCIAELPALNQLVKEYKNKDVVFLGISTDTKEMLTSQFFPTYKFNFMIIPNGANIVNQLGLTGFPTTYIVDKKGNVKTAWIGGSIDEEAKTAAYLKAKPIIDELLKAQ